MTRTFRHSFEPVADSPVKGRTVRLTVREIEDAGIKEVLQTSGARVSSWSILQALLQPGEDAFIFREPLGAAREVKVAASGLFGRFVARAYLQRYLGLTFFAHLGSSSVLLDGQRHLEVRRKRDMRGDLPDWIACGKNFGQITVAEAKGCHDRPGPEKTLKRAWQQVGRVDVLSDGRRLPVKRVAVATRWASKRGGSKTPIIAVRDPVEAGDEGAAAHSASACVGVARMHTANLLEPLGFVELARRIRAVAIEGAELALEGNSVSNAMQALEQVRPAQLTDDDMPRSAHADRLIGAVVTRAGPLPGPQVSEPLLRNLRSVDLRPMFVGMEREVIEAVIRGEPNGIREATPKRRVAEAPEDLTIDAAGTWCVPLGARHRISMAPTNEAS